jgi:hypothetical protein
MTATATGANMNGRFPSRVDASVQAVLDKLFAGFPPGAASAR